MAGGQQHPKRDQGGDKPQSKGKAGGTDSSGASSKNQPGKASQGGGSKGKNASGGNK